MGDSTETCKYCGTDFDEFYTPGFCSEDCFDRDKSESALNLLRNDHRFCGSCGGILKEVEPPDSDWVDSQKNRSNFALHSGGLIHTDDGLQVLDLTDCTDGQRTQTESVIGFQYRTDEAETVVKEFDGPRTHSRIRRTATGCICGCVDTRDTFEILRRSDPSRVLSNYVRAFDLLEQEGQLDQTLDEKTFYRTYEQTGDFDIALGKALRD